MSTSPLLQSPRAVPLGPVPVIVQVMRGPPEQCGQSATRRLATAPAAAVGLLAGLAAFRRLDMGELDNAPADPQRVTGKRPPATSDKSGSGVCERSFARALDVCLDDDAVNPLLMAVVTGRSSVLINPPIPKTTTAANALQPSTGPSSLGEIEAGRASGALSRSPLPPLPAALRCTTVTSARRRSAISAGPSVNSPKSAAKAARVSKPKLQVR